MLKKILVIIIVIIIVLQSAFIYIQFKKIESYKRYVENINYVILRDTVDRVVSTQNMLDDALDKNKIELSSLDWLLNNYKNMVRDSKIADSLCRSGKLNDVKSYGFFSTIYNQFQDLVINTKYKLEQNFKLNNIVYFEHICRYNKIFIDIMVKNGIVRFNDDRYITTEKFNINELVKDDMYVIKLFDECSAQMEAERRKIEAYHKKY